MCISQIMKKQLQDTGRSQTWVISKMNEISPKINMDSNKMSAIFHNKRKISGDELLAFCMALEISPDLFLNKPN